MLRFCHDDIFFFFRLQHRVVFQKMQSVSKSQYIELYKNSKERVKNVEERENNFKTGISIIFERN